eukprot:6142402-Ditylum_brightwellii.AAC.1
MVLWLTGLTVSTGNGEDIVNRADVLPFAVPDPNAVAAVKSTSRPTTTLGAITLVSADPC